MAGPLSAKPLGTARRLLTNGAWNGLSTAISGVFAFVLVPLVLNGLGEAAYGVWVLIGSLFAYSTILHFGLSSAINRHIPVALAQRREDDIRRVMSTGTIFFAGVAVVLVVATVVVHQGLTSWFAFPAALHAEARRSVLIVGGLLALSVSGQAFGAALSGYQRYDASAISRIVMVTLRATAIWMLLQRTPSLVTVAWIFALTELGVSLIQVVFALRLLPSQVIGLGWFDRGLLKEMFAYGTNTFLYTAGAIIAYKASEVIIGLFALPEDVARYSIAATGVLTLSAVVESLSAAIKPAVSDLDARDEAASIRELSLVTQKLGLILILPSTVFLVLMGGEFLTLWTGHTRADVAQAMAWIAVGQAFRLSQQSNFLVLVGKGEHRFFGKSVLWVGLLTVIATTIAVGGFGAGIVGAAMASCAAWVIVAGLVIPSHVNRQIGIPRAERRRRVLLPALATSAPGALLMLAWNWVHPPRSWVEIALVVAVIGAITLAATWALGLSLKERDRVRAGLARRRPPVPA